MSIERFDSIGLNAMYETNDGDYVYQADYQELAEHVKELEIQNALYAQLQESESNLKSQWMYYQNLLSLNGFDGITGCIAKNNELKKDLRTKEPMRAVTKIIMEDNDRLKDENTQLEANNAKLHKNYIKACKGRMDFRNSFRELKIQNMLIRDALEKGEIKCLD